MAKIQPVGARVIVRPEEEQIQTASGILLPEKKWEKPMRWTVVAVGQSTEKVSLTVKQWDTILFKKYSPTEVNIDGEELLILDGEDVLAIINQ